MLKILEGTTATLRAPDGRKPPQQERVSIDTDNVLFICAGSFDGLAELIERRTGRRSVGFRAAIKSRHERDVGEVLEHCLPEDLIEYGLIPEFVGRLPVMCTIHQLGEGELCRILTEPRNAVVAQFQQLFEFDGVDLAFAQDALSAIAHESLQRAGGARGLRSIIEELLLDLQFELPSRRDVRRCVVTRQTVEQGIPPILEPIGAGPSGGVEPHGLDLTAA